MANIAELKNAIGAGAKASKYRLNFSIPAAVPVSSNLQNADALCSATSFPGVTIGQIEVWGQGRKLVLPGDTTFENNWTVTFYLTEDHGLRKDLYSWMVSADNFQKNSHSGNPGDLMGELSVEQLDSAGNPTAKYTFHNVFVSELAEVAVSDETIDEISTFDCTFSFTDWVAGDGELPDAKAGGKPTLNSIA